MITLYTIFIVFLPLNTIIKTVTSIATIPLKDSNKYFVLSKYVNG